MSDLTDCIDAAELGPLVPLVKPARRTAGFPSKVSPVERLQIQRAYLLLPDATIKHLAEKFNRKRQTISDCLKGKDYDQLVAELHSHILGDVQNVLRQEAVNAAKKWAKMAVNVAAEKGDHKPAKDLLIAGKFVETEATGPQIIVQVGVKISEGHAE